MECSKHHRVLKLCAKELSIKHTADYKSPFWTLLTAHESVLPFDMPVQLSLTLMGLTHAAY